MSELHDIEHDVTQVAELVQWYILKERTIYKIHKFYSNTTLKKNNIHIKNKIIIIKHKQITRETIYYLVSFCCKAEGYWTGDAGDGAFPVTKGTMTSPYCALFALRHIQACRDESGQVNTTGWSRRDRDRGAEGAEATRSRFLYKFFYNLC